MWVLRRGEQLPHHEAMWRGHMASALPLCFNADVALPRLLFLVSPTCEICVAGAMSVAHTVLSLPRADAFRLYILWLPVLEAVMWLYSTGHTETRAIVNRARCVR
jgi:hypothetical protein